MGTKLFLQFTVICFLSDLVVILYQGKGEKRKNRDDRSCEKAFLAGSSSSAFVGRENKCESRAEELFRQLIFLWQFLRELRGGKTPDLATRSTEAISTKKLDSINRKTGRRSTKQWSISTGTPLKRKVYTVYEEKMDEYILCWKYTSKATAIQSIFILRAIILPSMNIQKNDARCEYLRMPLTTHHTALHGPQSRTVPWKSNGIGVISRRSLFCLNLFSMRDEPRFPLWFFSIQR